MSSSSPASVEDRGRPDSPLHVRQQYNRIMQTIYLDHNIARYFVRGFPSNVDGSLEPLSLQKCLVSNSDVRFVVSDWNLVEAARDCVHEADPLYEVARYADFFESLRPLFIDGHDVLERAEMRAYAYLRLSIPSTPRHQHWMFSTEFTQVALSRTPEVLVGFDLRIYLRHLVKTDASRAEIHQSVGVAQKAQQTGIDAHNDGRLLNTQKQVQVLRDWFLTLLPERDSDRRWISLDRRRELADELSRSPDEVFRRCPAVFTEDVMAEIRTMTGGRKARPQDSFDLMHVIPALAYCDAFVSNDGPLAQQAKQACLRTGRSVVIAPTLSDAASKLQVGSSL
jgi:hypothetical protein